MSVQQILQTLNDLIDAHDRLYEMEQKKTTHLVEGKIEKMAQLLRKQEPILLHIRNMEKKLYETAQNVLARKHVLPGKATMDALLRFAAGEEREPLEEARRQLTSVIQKIRQQNELNEDLIRQSLMFVNLSLNMTRPEAKPDNYEKPGTRRSQHRSSPVRFDSHV